MELNPPSPPNPEKFGLTQDRINYFNKRTAVPNGSIIVLSIVANFVICICIFYILFPKTGIPFLVFIFLAIFPGFVFGGTIADKIAVHRIGKAKRLSDYPNYLNFTKAIKEQEEALKAYNDLLRKIRRDDVKKRREQKRINDKAAEWCHGIDGRSFELEVAKLLMSKKFNVKHTGSSFGDRGIDLLLKANDKIIIIQCKAFKNYISAGVVRELYGTLIHEKADEAWLVVTSGFYKGAKEFAHDKPIRLMTIRDLIKLKPNESGQQTC